MRRRMGEFRARCGILGGGLVAAGVLLAGPVAGAATAQTTATASYTTPGSYEFIVPAGVTSITGTVIGAAGGFGSEEAPGGSPAAVTATLPVTPGEQLLVGVGGAGGSANAGFTGVVAGGIGGGGAGAATLGAGGGGGGASLIAAGAPGVQFGDLLVGGGGGGGGSDGFGAYGGNAGAAGLDGGGGPGTQTAGGSGGGGDVASGGAGSFGLGGNTPDEGGLPGGGGGGGYYGGGAGGSGNNSGGLGGGGGSSYVSSQASNVSGPSVDSGEFTGGAVSITYAVPTASLSTQAITFAGVQPQGVAGPAQALTVTNNGSAPLSVSGVMLGGADPADYVVDNECRQPVAPGSSCTVNVRFSPQAQGASTATLTVLTDAPAATAAVTLSGTGGPLPHGTPGPQGPAGATGPQGPAGPAGTIVCRNTVAARLLCSVEFAPGTYTVAGGSETAAFSVSRGHRTVASGKLRIRRGRTAQARIQRVPAGKYTLTITVGHGRGQRVLLRDSIEVR